MCLPVGPVPTSEYLHFSSDYPQQGGMKLETQWKTAGFKKRAEPGSGSGSGGESFPPAAYYYISLATSALITTESRFSGY